MKRILAKCILAIAVVSISLMPTYAANWVRIGDKHYIDVDSIRPSTNYGTYTMLTKYVASGAPLEVVNGRDVWTIKTNSFVDCPGNYAKTISYTAYDSRDRIITSGRNVFKQWYDINRPGSRAYESYEFVCTDRHLDTYPGYEKIWLY